MGEKTKGFTLTPEDLVSKKIHVLIKKKGGRKVQMSNAQYLNRRTERDFADKFEYVGPLGKKGKVETAQTKENDSLLSENEKLKQKIAKMEAEKEEAEVNEKIPADEEPETSEQKDPPDTDSSEGVEGSEQTADQGDGSGPGTDQKPPEEKVKVYTEEELKAIRIKTDLIAIAEKKEIKLEGTEKMDDIRGLILVHQSTQENADNPGGESSSETMD